MTQSQSAAPAKQVVYYLEGNEDVEEDENQDGEEENANRHVRVNQSAAPYRILWRIQLEK